MKITSAVCGMSVSSDDDGGDGSSVYELPVCVVCDDSFDESYDV